MGPCLGLYGSLKGWAFFYERGTPVKCNLALSELAEERAERTHGSEI